jgi:hypothetical protein
MYNVEMYKYNAHIFLEIVAWAQTGCLPKSFKIRLVQPYRGFVHILKL